MSKLDQFFKKKLDDRAFNYEDDAWEGMEGLLDAVPEKKSRRLWWLMLLMVLGIGGLLYVNYGEKPAEIAMPEKQVEKNMGAEVKSDKLNISQDETAENEASETIEGNQQSRTGGEVVSNENTVGGVREGEKNNTIDAEGIKSADAATSLSEMENGIAQSENLESSNGNKNEQKITTPIIRSAQLEGEKNDITLKQELTSKNKLLSDAENTEEATVLAEQLALGNKAANSQSEHATSSVNINLVEKIIERQTDLFAKLLLKSDELKATSETFYFSKKPADFSSYKTLRLGILAEQSFLLPFAKNQEVSISNLGPVVQFELNKKWQIQTGLQYKYVKNKVVSVDSVDVNTFGFGLRQIAYHQQIEALHYLGWQGLLERRFKLLRVGLGLEIDANLTAFGSLNSKQSAFPWESDQAASTTKEKGNVNSDFVSRLLVAPQLKISYEVARNTSLSLGIKYQLQDFLIADASRTLPLWTEKSLQFKVGLTYYFFNRKKRINER